MVVRKSMSNLVIYNKANALLQEFSQLEDMILPVKVHFYLQKNMEKIVAMAQELEKQRMGIIEKYDKRAFVERILYLLKNVDFVKKVGENAKIELYITWEDVGNKLLILYN